MYDLLKVSSPAIVHFPMSYLEVACLDLSFTSEFLERASKESDPLQRMKLIVSGFVAG